MGTVKDAKGNQNITLDNVEIIEKGEIREFSRMGRLGRVCSCKIKDASGTMTLSLWNDEIETLNKGDHIKLTDGWCKEWQGEMQASTGKNGKIEKV